MAPRKKVEEPFDYDKVLAQMELVRAERLKKEEELKEARRAAYAASVPGLKRKRLLALLSTVPLAALSARSCNQGSMLPFPEEAMPWTVYGGTVAGLVVVVVLFFIWSCELR